MYKTTITDNYILITSDEEIKPNDWFLTDDKRVEKSAPDWSAREWHKKVIAHLPLNNAPILEGVPLLPPLPSGEDDVEKLKKEYLQKVKEEIKDESQHIRIGILGGSDFGFMAGYNKAKEKYRFSEEDMRKAIELSYSKGLAKPNSGRLSDIPNVQNEIIQSLSQPKMPIGFKVEMEVCYFSDVLGDEYKPKIINGIMQGEWIY